MLELEALLKEHQFTIQALVAFGTVGVVFTSLFLAYITCSSRFLSTIGFWYGDSELTFENLLESSFITITIINHSHHSIYFHSQHLLRIRIPFTTIYREFIPIAVDKKFDDYIEIPSRKMHVLGFSYFNSGLHHTIQSLIPKNKRIRWVFAKFAFIEIVSANRVVKRCRLTGKTRENLVWLQMQ